MLYLLYLVGLAYVASAQQKKQCLSSFMKGLPGKMFKASDAIAKVNALEADIRACKVQLGNCDGGGGEQGGKPSVSGSAESLIIRRGDDRFAFAITSQMPIGAAFDEIDAQAREKLDMDDDHEWIFEYDIFNATGTVGNDQDLEEALSFASAMGVILTINVRRDTLAPTHAPTVGWGLLRNVHQVYGKNDDGRDEGYANGRILKFVKESPADGDTWSTMRLHYEDNLRAHSDDDNEAICYWEMYIDEKRCPGDYVRGAVSNNDHSSSTIIGHCDGIQEGDHTWTVKIYGNKKDCYTGWDPEDSGVFVMEAKEVRSGWFGYFAKTGRGSTITTNNLQFPIADRTLNFTKAEAGTSLRLLYADNFRVKKGDKCRWHLKVDGKNCRDGKWIVGLVRNDHSPSETVNQALFSYCNGIPVGDHWLGVGVQGSGDCTTGWESSFHMEVEEVAASVVTAGTEDPVADNGRFVYLRQGTFEREQHVGYVQGRELLFKKTRADSVIRLAYSDNFRVNELGKWCKWEVRVNMKSCGQKLSGYRTNQNFAPSMIAGYCTGLGVTEGDAVHKMQVYVKGNGKCTTGRDFYDSTSIMMEAVELDAGDLVGVTNNDKKE